MNEFVTKKENLKKKQKSQEDFPLKKKKIFKNEGK